MADKEFWTEARLKAAIKWAVVGIIAVILATAGVWYYYSVYPKQAPTILDRSLDEALKKSAKSPKDISLHLAVAEIYMQQKKYDDAINELETTVKLDKNNDMAYALEGICYEAKGNDKKAETSYLKAISIGDKREMQGVNPALFESYYRLGRMYFRQSKNDKALEMMTKASSVNNIDSDSLYWLGRIYFAKGDFAKAEENLLKATRFAPDFYEAQYWLGQTYEKLGKKAEAIKAYEQALSYKKNYTQAQDALNKLKK
jgi:tetratricopeptide (TPR) repeat protein